MNVTNLASVATSLGSIGKFGPTAYRQRCRQRRRNININLDKEDQFHNKIKCARILLHKALIMCRS
jgi:hypothetical protein